MRATRIAAATLALLAFCAPSGRAQQPTLEHSAVVGGLEDPWDVAFLPAGHMLFTQKCKGLYILPTDASSDTGYATAPTALWGTDPEAAVVADDAFCLGQSGFNGVTVDPAFGAQNRFIYVFFPSSLSTPNTNRVARFSLSADLASVSERTDIVEDIALKNQQSPNGMAGAHSGGRIRFGPDGFLYITTGDNHNATIPQDLQSLGAKVLRVTRGGDAAPDNGTPDGGDPRIYTYGHRNVQGIAFRPGSGQPFSAEHGPNHSDEVTGLVPGGNAGWDPKDRPGLTCPDNYCGYAGDIDTMPMTDTQRFPDAMPPAWVWNGENRGLGPAEFLQGPQWGPWDGALAVGIMADTSMYVLTLGESGMATGAQKAEGLPAQRYRSLIMGPGQDLFTAIDDGAIWRVVANGGAAAGPVAAPRPRCEPGLSFRDGDAPAPGAPAPAPAESIAAPVEAGAEAAAGAAAAPPPPAQAREAAPVDGGAGSLAWCSLWALTALAGAALTA